jgi:asparagine synthase (glutamine-hydrolysing)
MFFDMQERRAMLRPEILERLGARQDEPERRLATTWRSDRDLVSRMTSFDFEHFLRDDVLAKVDRASMAVSLEVRCPWLDLEVVDFAFRDVPSDAKVTTSATRILPRRLLAAWVPRDLDFTRKQGFSIPLEAWLRGRWRHELDRPMTALTDWVRPEYVSALVDGLRKGRSNGARWYALAVLDHWCGAPAGAACVARLAS